MLNRRPTKAELTAPLCRFIQEIEGRQWHTLAGFLNTEAAENAMKLLAAKRNDSAIWCTDMGRQYRIVTDDGLHVV